VAGLVTRTELDGDELPPDEAAELRERVAASGLMEVPSGSAAAAHPDEQRYELTVTDGDGDHVVRLGERELPEGVRSLVEWADGHPRRRQRVERG
jgi:hypothetical protein